jgi:hypothetical protein
MVPDSVEQWSKHKSKDGEIAPPDKTQEKQLSISEGISYAVDKAVEFTKSIFNSSDSNVVNAPSNTSITNIHASPILTRNDDWSFGVRLG